MGSLFCCCAGAHLCVRPRGVEDAAPYKQPPTIRLRAGHARPLQRYPGPYNAIIK